MNITAVVFDIGQTLIEYNKPLNWQKLYKPALKKVSEKCNLKLTDEKIEKAIEILTKYNTRVNPRDYEVNSSQIFEEIIWLWKEKTLDVNLIKENFFSFFRLEAKPFPEVEELLKFLKNNRIKLGVLSDVAYGMDNKYALEDIVCLTEYLDVAMTSNDVGYRKPNPLGLQLIAQKFNTEVSTIIFVGDEEKDIICAKNAGALSALVIRNGSTTDYGQDITLSHLNDLIKFIF